MRSLSRRGVIRFAFAAAALVAVAAPARAQTVPRDRLEIYAKAYVEIGRLRDRFEAEFAEARNKKPEAQQQLQETLRQEVANVLQQHALSDAEYRRITFAVSSDSGTRAAFDRIMGIEPPAAAAQADAAADANPHIGHITTAFQGTPDGGGLLPTALAEARVAAQHAALAARDPENLDAMKQHAAHVLHAVEAGDNASGPGRGYGLKQAAAAVAMHIELAARAEGAPEAVQTHAVHVATAARNTVERADRIAGLAKQVLAAASAAEAAPLVGQLASLAAELVPGADADGDGRIGWEHGEGGLQHVEQHVALAGGAR
jgi:hypothetical protein